MKKVTAKITIALEMMMKATATAATTVAEHDKLLTCRTTSKKISPTQRGRDGQRDGQRERQRDKETERQRDRDRARQLLHF